MSKRLIEYEGLSKRIIDTGVKEKNFLPHLSYLYEIFGRPYCAPLPKDSLLAEKYGKLGCFDLDGTLNKVSTPPPVNSSISKICEECKIEEEKIWRVIKQMLKDKNLDLAEEGITKILRNSNFNYSIYEEISEEVAHEFIPVGNTKELIQEMKRLSYGTILASLGFERPVKLIGERLGFDASYGSKVLFSEDGKFQRFQFLRKEEKRDEIFKTNFISHGCYFILDDNPNFAPVLKTGVNPYFLVGEEKGEPFDTFICIPEARTENDMLLILDSLKRWEIAYVETCLNTPEEELEKVKIAEENKNHYKKFSETGSKFCAEHFHRSALSYILKEKMPEKKAKLLELLTLFEINFDLDCAKEIHELLSNYPAYKMSDKFKKILEG